MLICVNQNEDLGVPYLDLAAELVRHSASSGRMVQWLPFLRQPRKVGMGRALRCLVCLDFGLPAHPPSRSETRTPFFDSIAGVQDDPVSFRETGEHLRRPAAIANLHY